MTIPINNLTMHNIRSEFGWPSFPGSISSYYAGGLVSNPPPPGNPNFQTGPIPTSGPISFGNFRGVTKATPVSITLPQSVDMYGHGNGPWPVSESQGYNATNLHFILTAGGGMPAVSPGQVYTWSFYCIDTWTPYTAQLLNPQDSSGSSLTIPQNQPNDSIKDFVVGGNYGGYISTYRISVTDGITTATVQLGVGLSW